MYIFRIKGRIRIIKYFLSKVSNFFYLFLLYIILWYYKQIRHMIIWNLKFKIGNRAYILLFSKTPIFFCRLLSEFFDIKPISICNLTKLKGMTFGDEFFYFIFPFIFSLFLGGKRKREKNNQSRGQKSCLWVWSCNLTCVGERWIRLARCSLSVILPVWVKGE